MPIQVTQDGEAMRAAIDGELTIFTVETLQDELLGLLNHPSVRIDLSTVTELDGCGAQLLCVLLAEARRMERDVSIAGSNALVDEVGNWLGFAAETDAARMEGAGEGEHGS
ncbi:STAS domain-containing protein [Chromobacterium subtsugae]|uniref:STAS domain-containing protein n=1 Tax=Chromobacterium subtsugae TaxID=251747 RepID=A0ABS7FD35_9NEIS|nr:MULTISPECIES: STAS domain-containing protein [Chromobacterium]KUM05107.1 hypothetical protein Cv017_10755 [Chromobacterium subtsugae]KZE88166.1 hypothetical protein AWB61_07455 [Chromobacterium sp. F49]MBW7565660.1 STAS domain-containing protein [Chromobacterium subtsugae]MBW8287991.1 STAS domain-containing protein [Chromobacterium subtsugae]WSE89758.1 STAS domain-containing protein [Chromobacterium subtsugae]